MNHSQNFEIPLENTPDKNAKICFTLSVKFLGECHDESAFDISFQANNLNQTANDMTFRPASKEKPLQKKTQDNFFKGIESPFNL